MRVLFAIASLILLAGCAIVQQVQQKAVGAQTAFGPCRPAYRQWEVRVAGGTPDEVRTSEQALVACLRQNGVTAPIDLVIHDFYGATPPPRYGPSQPRRDLEVEVRAIPLTAHRYTP